MKRRELVKMYEDYFVYRLTNKKVQLRKLEDFEKDYGWSFVPYSDYYDWFRGFYQREYATLIWIETNDGNIIRVKEDKIREYSDDTPNWSESGETVEECLKRHNLRKEDIVRIIVNKVVSDDNNDVYEETITIYE